MQQQRKSRRLLLLLSDMWKLSQAILPLVHLWGFVETFLQ
jgi:hypothetical protein